MSWAFEAGLEDVGGLFSFAGVFGIVYYMSVPCLTYCALRWEVLEVAKAFQSTQAAWIAEICWVKRWRQSFALFCFQKGSDPIQYIIIYKYLVYIDTDKDDFGAMLNFCVNIL